MEFSCSICEYTSKKKSSVHRHINKKISCGIGKKEIIEIPIEMECEYCNKKFNTMSSLSRHKKSFCKKINIILEEENKKLKEKIIELEKSKSNTTNNYIQNIIILNNYENTNLEKITDKLYNRLINDSDAYQLIPKLIKEIHFNKDTPENHNVYLSNRTKNNKYLNVYNDGRWQLANKETEIENIISDKETNLSDWIDEKGGKYPEAAERFNEYLEQKYEPDVAKLIKEEVELALYNGRHMINNI
jgi:hypothetical protein